MKVTQVYNFLYSISDHLPQFHLLCKPNTSLGGKDLGHTKNWSKFDQINFILDFFNIDWETELYVPDLDVDQAFQIFDTKLQHLVDLHVPTIKVTKRQHKTRLKPWITSGILKSISKRDFLFHKFSKAKDPVIKTQLHKSFKSYRNLIVSLIRKSKTNHYTKYFNSHSSNMQKIWKGINELIGSKSSTSLSTPSIRIGQSLTSDPISVANEKIKNPNPNSIFLNPSSSLEVFNIIKSLSLNKSSGPHSIPTKILKLFNHDISKPLSFLFNLSFQTGKFPSLLKVSCVIPIFKKGSSTDVSNYRPISLLSNIEKILEKLMYSRLYSFLDNHKALYDRQFGFRKSHSTINTLLNIVERIRKSLDEGYLACGVFVDLQKAFDTVDHSILISKLKHYGVRGIANNWFRSYLSGRMQFVSLSHLKSTVKLIKHGVPQGSVLGPLLFLLYINDLHIAIKSCETFHFAGDTHLLHFNPSLKSLCNRVNQDLKRLLTWLKANKISLNAGKTEFVLFRSQRIYPKSSVKYLGVYLDDAHYYILQTLHVEVPHGFYSKS